MMIRSVRGLPTLLLITAGVACGQLDPSPADEPAAVAALATDASAPLAPPPGTRPGEPYRWLSRSWRSPLGLTIRTYGVAIDGIAVHGRHQVEAYDDAGALVYRAGSGDAVLAELRARGTAAWATWQHPRAALARAQAAPSNPLAHTRERAVWRYTQGDVVAAVETERVDLRGAAPVGEATVDDAVTGAELARRRTIYELEAPSYLVYARPDGRPWTSPLGNTLPHPTGVPDGSVPSAVPQQLRRQHHVRQALSDPWLPPGATQSRGNNVVAFFDSMINADGIFVDFVDADGNETPEYGPEPDEAGHDLFAHATAGQFAFPYDPNDTVNEYFQIGVAGDPMAFPDPDDIALNAKIVQTFYDTNWLHDVFYRAGFDEVAGNAQQSNLGRGGVEGDPLIVHAGFITTFTFPAAEGESPVLDLGLNTRSASHRDQGVDFSTLSHEWGHYLIGRLAGGTADTDALGNLQGQSLHEGIADFVSVLVNFNDGDDPHDTFAVGSYGNLDYIERRPTLPPEEAPADAMYYGIRRYPYSLDFTRNPLTLRHLAEPPPASLPFYNWKGRGPLLSEVHTAGEVFAEALFTCFGNMVTAHHHHARGGQVRDRMAAYLVAALAAFRDHPSMLDARNAFLAVIRIASPDDDYPACRAGFAARGMGAGALGPDREFGDPFAFPPSEYDPASIEESYLDADRALRLGASTFTAASGAPGSGELRVELRNTGVVDLAHATIEIKPAVPAAVAFPDGRRVRLAPIAPEEVATAVVAAVVNACRLPTHPSQPGFRALDYTVTATAAGGPSLHRELTYHLAVAAPATCPRESPTFSRALE
jgi:hypothetical protein